MERIQSLTASTLALGELLQRLYKQIVDAQGISAMHFAILHALGRRGGLKMADLTALMGMTKGNLTYHIDQLEASGWVRREPSATDRRVTELTLTDQGRAILQRVSEEFKGRFERLGSQVSATEMVMMNAGLELLLARSELLMDVEAPDA